MKFQGKRKQLKHGTSSVPKNSSWIRQNIWDKIFLNVVALVSKESFLYLLLQIALFTIKEHYETHLNSILVLPLYNVSRSKHFQNGNKSNIVLE